MKKSKFLFLTMIALMSLSGSSCNRDTPALEVDIFTAIDGYTVAFSLGDLKIETFNWDFGDGSTSNEANPVHTYATDGTFTVTLNVTNTDARGTASNEILLSINSMKTSFYGDWESGQVTGSGNHNWRFKEVVDADRISLIKDGNARQGSNYVRVGVRPGDNPLDCCQGSERAEVSGMQDEDNNHIYENLGSGIQRYTFSVKFDESWQTIVEHYNNSGAWGIFLQLHGPNYLLDNPAWAFSATDKIHFNMRVGDLETSTKNVRYDLTNGALNIGHWIDFILTVRYAKDNTGFVNIMRRDEGQSNFIEVLDISDTPTLQYSSNVNGGSVDDHYLKYGLYRNQQNFTSILYLDGFTRQATN